LSLATSNFHLELRSGSLVEHGKNGSISYTDDVSFSYPAAIHVRLWFIPSEAIEFGETPEKRCGMTCTIAGHRTGFWL
jgi:hypothetical protein